jgi:hypothetical protein
MNLDLQHSLFHRIELAPSIAAGVGKDVVDDFIFADGYFSLLIAQVEGGICDFVRICCE